VPREVVEQWIRELLDMQWEHPKDTVFMQDEKNVEPVEGLFHNALSFFSFPYLENRN
jgi:hypothetical protein